MYVRQNSRQTRAAANGSRRPEMSRLCPNSGAMLILVFAGFSVAGAVPFAQQPTTGLNIAPVYEGWEQNADGSFDLIFGYFNRNWNEWINVPVGAANSIEPGGP